MTQRGFQSRTGNRLPENRHLKTSGARGNRGIVFRRHQQNRKGASGIANQPAQAEPADLAHPVAHDETAKGVWPIAKSPHGGDSIVGHRDG